MSSNERKKPRQLSKADRDRRKEFVRKLLKEGQTYSTIVNRCMQELGIFCDNSAVCYIRASTFLPKDRGKKENPELPLDGIIVPDRSEWRVLAAELMKAMAREGLRELHLCALTQEMKYEKAFTEKVKL